MRFYHIFPLMLVVIGAGLLGFSSLPASASVAVSGTVVALISPTQFTYQTGYPHGYVPVVYSESTVVPSGVSIRVGQHVMVVGNFLTGGQLLATSVTITSLYHIATWAYDRYNGEGESVSAATINQLVSYAEGNEKAVADCHSSSVGCKAVFYLDPSHITNNTPSSCYYYPDTLVVAAASEDWYVHNTGYKDAKHRVRGEWPTGCLIWQINPASTSVQAWWLVYLQANANDYDLFRIDDDVMNLVAATYFKSGGGCAPWPSPCYSTQELPNDAAVVAARVSFVEAMRYSNGRPMYFLSQGTILPAMPYTNRFIGESCEGCVANPKLTVNPSHYSKVLDEMALINATPARKLLLSKGNAPAGSSVQILQRLVTIGIVWLGYSEGHTIVWPDLEEGTDRLAIWPEDLMYPSAALQSMSTGSSDLLVASGVYRREFATCYQRSVFFGQCAAIVNANPFAVTVQSSWLHQAYGHVVTLVGGDVLSGGVVNLASTVFRANSTTIPAGGALLLAK